jgi:hypothetical protein
MFKVGKIIMPLMQLPRRRCQVSEARRSRCHVCKILSDPRETESRRPLALGCRRRHGGEPLLDDAAAVPAAEGGGGDKQAMDLVELPFKRFFVT